MSQLTERADAPAEKLRAAGLTVKRKDYPTMSHDGLTRSYVIVTDGVSRVEGQVHERLPEGHFAGYGGPDGAGLLDRVRALVS